MPEFSLSINNLSYKVVNLGPYYLGFILLALICYLFQRRLYRGEKPFNPYYIWLAIIFVLIIQLIIAYFEYGNSDVTGFVNAAEIVYSGGSLYEIPAHPTTLATLRYPPFYPYVLYLCKLMSVLTGIPLYVTVKIPAILVNSLLLVLILLTSLKTIRERQNVVLILAFSPILISVSSVLGQFDIIPTFFSFLAFILLIRSERNWWVSALCLGLAILAKSFPVILIPAFLAQFKTKKKAFHYLCVVLIPVIIGCMPLFISHPQGILPIIFHRGYESLMIKGSWGILGVLWMLNLFLNFIVKTSIFSNSINLIWKFYSAHSLYIMFVFIIASYLFYFRKISLLERIIYTYLVFYVFSHAVSPHYIVWILPFVIYANCQFSYGFNFLTVLWMSSYVFNAASGPLHIDIIRYFYPLVGGILWVYCICYLFSFYGKSSPEQVRKIKINLSKD